jgi:hypothetical protein
MYQTQTDPSRIDTIHIHNNTYRHLDVVAWSDKGTQLCRNVANYIKLNKLLFTKNNWIITVTLLILKNSAAFSLTRETSNMPTQNSRWNDRSLGKTIRHITTVV